MSQRQAKQIALGGEYNFLYIVYCEKAQERSRVLNLVAHYAYKIKCVRHLYLARQQLHKCLLILLSFTLKPELIERALLN